MRTILVASALAAFLPSVAEAATTPAAGYVYTRRVLSELTEGCVARAPGGVFVGAGPALSFPAPGKTRSILFVADTGGARVVATGLNSISDCVYDADAELLYVADSGGEFTGATTGDTVFAIPAAADAVAVDGLEVVAAGSIPHAFSLDVLPPGLLVSDATGSGAGSVIAIDLSQPLPAMSTFASGFDYTGGIAVDGSLVFVSEALQPNFDSAISSFTTAGLFQETIAGPGYSQGSVDLGITADGNLVASGSPTLVSVNRESGAPMPLVTGLDGGSGFDAYGGGLSVDRQSGRIDFQASSFTGAADDKGLHSLVPVDRMFPGGGNPLGDCAMELYVGMGGALGGGSAARSAECMDGAACDADGTADGTCTFSVGLCWNVADPRMPSCSASSLSSLELLAVRPASAEVTSLVDAVADNLPTTDGGCGLGSEYHLPVVTTPGGAVRKGKGIVRMRTLSSTAGARPDTDVVRFTCWPAP